MALPVRDQMKYWTAASITFLAAVWFLGDVMLPFVLAMAVAYLLDPVADRLETWGLSRALATVTISAGVALIFIFMALLIIPAIVTQATELVATAPQLVENLQGFLIAKFPDILNEESQIHQSLVQLSETLKARGGAFLTSALTSVMSLVNVLTILFLVPVLTFYLLMDWDRMVAEIDKLLPRDHAPIIRDLFKRIDQTMAAFIRGQGTVCAVLGIFYAVALMVVGLKFGLVIGAIAGLLTFIPYVGALVGGILAIGLALFQYWGGTEIIDGESVDVATNWLRIGLVIGVFFLGQFFEGNILTPNLVGSSIGLHPVWLIFALTAFGTVFGFIGMLIAVPVAASIGVIARFLIEQYQDSRLYTGLAGQYEASHDQDEPQDDIKSDA